MGGDDSSDLFVCEFNSYSALFLDLSDISPSLEFPVANVVNGEIEMVGVVDGSSANPTSEGFPEVFGGEGKFGGDGVKHVANLLFCLFQLAVLDGVGEVELGGGFRLEEVGDEPCAEGEVLGNCFELVCLHVDKLTNDLM